MNRILPAIAVLLFASTAFGQFPVVDQPYPRVQPETLPAPKRVTFDDALAQAVAESRPFVCFAGVPVQDVDAVTFSDTRDRDHLGRPSILFKLPNDPQWYRLNPDDDVEAEIARVRKAVKASPAFFDRSTSPRKIARPDRQQASPVGDGEFPVSLPFLKDMEPYRPATRVQLSTRRWSGAIGSTSRSVLESKWRVPGGLAGVDGWTSRMYRTPGKRAATFLVRQDPNDQDSTVTWSRRYGDVTFADVLRNREGRVFEVRVADKRNGQWERYIAYRDLDARPHGYTPVTSKQCVECHAAAGRSEYAGAAIPGADTILSEPLDEVESGYSVQGGFGVRL